MHKMTNMVWTHLYEIPRTDKFIETENRIEDGEGKWKLLFNRYRVSAQNDEKVLEIEN